VTSPFVRSVAAEFAGTTLLLAVVVGSGIMGERLAAGNIAIALLANSFATGCGLFVLILVFAPTAGAGPSQAGPPPSGGRRDSASGGVIISGAHFNPLITLVALAEGATTLRAAMLFVAAQLIGAVAGVALAHAMFELPAWGASPHVRSGTGQWLAEAVATCGLVLAIVGTRRYGVAVTAAAVGAYIAGAYWFTASTSFANPVVTIARSLTPTFTGIEAGGVLPFIAAQCVGAIIGYLVATALGLRADPASAR
jgi:glycerol uptake facilitator-like aquaporin